MKKFLLVAIIALSSISAFGQEQEGENFPNKYSGYLTFNPLTPLDFTLPRYRFGYTQGITEKLRFSVDLGYGSEAITLRRYDVFISDREDYELFEVRPEVYFILNPTSHVNMYLSLEGFYINHTETIFYDYYDLVDTNEQVRYDRADYQRKKYGAHFKFGVFIPFGHANRVGINVFTGVGFRVKENLFTNIQNPVSSNGDFYENDDWFWNPYYRIEGRTLGFNATLGFKLFYKLY